MNCPLCDSTNVSQKPCRFTEMMQCGACGFIFATNPTDSSAPDLYEEEWSKTEVHPTFIYSQGCYTVRNEWKLQALLDRLEPFRKTNRLLDVGCSAAFFLKLARDRKWDVQGVEVSDFGVTFSREELGIPVFQGLLQDAHFPDESFDAAFSSHVIEHVGYPVTLLQEMKRVLRPGGALITVLPTQFASPSYRFFRKWTGEGPPRHVSYFTKRVFEDRLRRLGFSVHFSRQNVEMQKVLSILLRRHDAAGATDVVPSSATTQESSSPFVRVIKSALNLAATGFGVGDELTTIAVKNSTPTH
jgi:SAM-dependent methyltransferase